MAVAESDALETRTVPRVSGRPPVIIATCRPRARPGPARVRPPPRRLARGSAAWSPPGPRARVGAARCISHLEPVRLARSVGVGGAGGSVAAAISGGGARRAASSAAIRARTVSLGRYSARTDGRRALVTRGGDSGIPEGGRRPGPRSASAVGTAAAGESPWKGRRPCGRDGGPERFVLAMSSRRRTREDIAGTRAGRACATRASSSAPSRRAAPATSALISASRVGQHASHTQRGAWVTGGPRSSGPTPRGCSTTARARR